jgi:hypothetical protein
LAEPVELGVSLPGMTVSAIVTDAAGLPSSSITLYDDGLHGDGGAGDGLYGESFTSVSTGRHIIKGSVIGQRTSAVAFERHSIGHFDVAAGSAVLAGTYQDFGNDVDGNGLFEELLVTADLNVTNPGAYQVVGVLGTPGFEVAQKSTRVTAASSGTLGVDLVFDGIAIYLSGIDGPYTLLDISVYDETTGLILEDAVANAFVTGGYLHSDFESPDAPSLVSLSPNYGSIGGGEDILLAGSGFNDPGLEVWFGERKAKVLEIITEGQIRVRVPSPGPISQGSGGRFRKAKGVSKNQHVVALKVITDFGEDLIHGAYTYLR